MKKLPEIYKSNINPQDNNKTICHLENKEELDNVFNDIFNKYSHPYDIKVIIKTKEKTIEDYIISKTNNYIYLLNNDKVHIKDIEYIRKKTN